MTWLFIKVSKTKIMNFFKHFLNFLINILQLDIIDDYICIKNDFSNEKNRK